MIRDDSQCCAQDYLHIRFPLTLVTGIQLCCGDGSTLSITRSNNTVILTWPQNTNNWVLAETEGLDYSYVSNDIAYRMAYRRYLVPTNNYVTAGSNVFVVVPITSSAQKFFLLETNRPGGPLPPTVTR